MQRKYAVCCNEEPFVTNHLVPAALELFSVFDRDRDMIIVDSEQEQEQLIEWVRDQSAIEPLHLLLIPQNTSVRRNFNDYGFTSAGKNIYLYGDLTAVFHFENSPSQPSAVEREQAYRQMEEHVIASFCEEGLRYYVVERQLTDLIHGIARAYYSAVRFAEPS